MSKKLISIIIPMYNAESTIKLCLESVLKQTYKNLEIIIINDGSKDKSLEICNSFLKVDKRLIIINQKNGGVSNARNNGIKKSTGDFILFLDSDDYIDDIYVENLVGLLDNKKNILPMCDKKIFIDQNEEKNDNNTNKSIVTYDKKKIYKLYQTGLMNPPFCKLFDSKIIKNKNILFDESVSLGEDLLFNLEYLKNIDKVVLSNGKYYNYRVGNSNSLSKKYYSNMFEIQNKLYSRFDETFDNIDANTRKRMIIDFYMSSVSNEFHNKKNNFIKNYIKAKQIIKNDIIQKVVNRYKNEMGIIFHFLISNGFVLAYIVYKKINWRINK